ncbi:MAG: ArsA family ATPase [Gemmatimonadota bacterium]
MLAPHLKLGERLTLVGGKGGVGKTTVAAALGLELADRGEPVNIVSVDPAHSLGDALGVTLPAGGVGLRVAPDLEALEVDPERERVRFLDQHGQDIRTLIERGTYLDVTDVQELTGLALPGMDEVAALLSLSRLSRDFGGKLIVDTAPTGHTLRLLGLPQVAARWLEALEAMEAKHAAVASTFGAYVEDAATRFLRDLRSDLQALDGLLRDPKACRFLLVTTSEAVVIPETLRLQSHLEQLGVAAAGVVVNRQRGPVARDAAGEGMIYVPLLDADPRGVEGLRRFADSASTTPPASRPVSRTPAAGRVGVADRYLPPLDRSLYFVGGKGGVGKSTAAAALAVRLADEREGGVLLLSLDPAGSLSEVLGTVVGPEPADIGGVPGLTAQQLDAGAAWSTFRGRYRAEVDELFAGFLSSGTSAALDQDVVEALVDLAPPGVDELMALMEVIDVTEDRPYDALVLDTAPTGHLLRLLEMPELAIEWAHALLRLFLKYREVVSLTGVGERVLGLSRQLRELRVRLADGSDTFFLAVALPESLSVPETARLLPRLRELQIQAGALLVNRALHEHGQPLRDRAAETAELAAIDRSMVTAGAPALDVGPTGPAALRRFIDGWRLVELDERPTPDT